MKRALLTLMAGLLALAGGCEPDVDVVGIVLPPPDTIQVTDTLTVIERDTIVIDSTRFAIRDSVSLDLAGFITVQNPVRELGALDLPDHEPTLGHALFLTVELSGDDQLDEAFVVLVGGSPVVDCVVPDGGFRGQGRVFAGSWHDDRPIDLVAEHAALYACYEGRFRTGESVHFRRATVYFYRLEARG